MRSDGHLVNGFWRSTAITTGARKMANESSLPTRDEEEWSTTMTKKKKKAKSRGTYKKKKKSGLLATAAESVPDSRGCVIHQLAGFTHGPRVMQCSARLVPVLSSTVANYPPAASFPEVSSAAAANATPLATYPYPARAVRVIIIMVVTTKTAATGLNVINVFSRVGTACATLTVSNCVQYRYMILLL